MKASNGAGGSSRPMSNLTCNLAPGRAGADDDGPPQPQTATCCTALHRGPASTQTRFAPIRTRGSAALMLDDDDEEDRTVDEEETGEGHGEQPQQKKKMSKTPTRKAAEATKTMIKKMVRKCKSSVADVDASRVAADTGTPARLRRSGAVRRDWSFEDLHAGGGHSAA